MARAGPPGRRAQKEGLVDRTSVSLVHFLLSLTLAALLAAGAPPRARPVEPAPAVHLADGAVSSPGTVEHGRPDLALPPSGSSGARRGRRPTSDSLWKNRIVGHGDEDPAALVTNPANWRTHTALQRRALDGALGEVGWVAQVVVNVRTGRIVDGHLRVERALAHGEPTVPVLYVDLSEAEEQFVVATLDPLGAMATADPAKLAELLASVTPSNDALRSMLAGLADQHGIGRAGHTDPDDAPPLPDPAALRVRVGELYALGDHRLLVGDGTDRAAVARLMAGELAECIWTDPPWGVAYEGKTRARLTIANDDPAGSTEVVAGALWIAPLAPSARFYIAAPTGPRSLDFRLAIRDAGWRLHQELVWLKQAIVLGHLDYNAQHEAILYGYLPGSGRPGRGRHAGSKWHGGNAQSSVLAYPRPAASREHPTMKPIGLISQCLRNSTAPGDIVFDGFIGSGSTLLAAETTGRRCYALELAPAYAQVTIERWEAFTGRTAVRHD